MLIAAFAERFQGIITRNASDFRNILPEPVVAGHRERQRRENHSLIVRGLPWPMKADR